MEREKEKAEGVLVGPGEGRLQRAFDMWLKDNAHVKEQIDLICERGGIEPSYPLWLFKVPVVDGNGEPLAAAIRHANTAVHRAKRRAEVKAKVEAHQEAVRVGERVYIDGIAKAGYDLTYMYLAGYVVALAFKASGKPNEMYVYFSIATAEDLEDNRNWRHESRKRLFDRIEKDDDKHSFACLVQGCGKMGQLMLANCARHRFIEYVWQTGKGLPQPLVSIIRRAGTREMSVPKFVGKTEEHYYGQIGKAVRKTVARKRARKCPVMREHDL